jgi:hypothetical protein
MSGVAVDHPQDRAGPPTELPWVRYHAGASASGPRLEGAGLHGGLLRCECGTWRAVPGPVERWFGELTTKKLQRGTHRSVRALNADIRDWIKTWNDNPRPYVWTKTADQILDSIARYCSRINDSRH